MSSMIPWRKERNGSRALQRSAHPLSRLRDEFDNLFDEFFGRWPAAFAPEETFPNWGLEMEDTDKDMVVRAEAPGFEAGDFDIQVSGTMLTIRAERKQETGERGKDFAHSERRLQRTVTLPAGTDTDKVEAHYRNGILELRLPKNPEAQPKRIEVKA